MYEPGKAEYTLTDRVVEISDPQMQGKDWVCRYKLFEDKAPTSGGATPLFIDWIGPGSGAGAGFGGAAAGGRGGGLR